MAAIAVLAVVGVSAVSVCGDIEDRSLCPVYEDFLAQRAVVQGIDLDSTSAAEAAEVAEDYLERCCDCRRSPRPTTRQPARQRLEDWRSATSLATLESVPDDADSSTWEPLIEDDLEDAADAAVTVDGPARGAVPGSG